MTPLLFYSEWNQIIKDWYTTKNALASLMDKGHSLSLDHVPEPYYGDMDNCSIVIINLNPGTGLCEQCWQNQNKPAMMVNEIKEDGYSSFAQSFPMLQKKGPKPSVNWWKIRKAWIDRILNAEQVNNDKMPFAIELVPLHSKSFKVANTDSYVKMMAKNHPNLDVIDAIEYAIGKSDAKMGIAVGRPIYDVLTNNGFDTIRAPFSPDPGIKRSYAVIGRNGHPEILCTWSSGSNSAPAEAFAIHEQEIIHEYFSM
jgi:hypothetical protein